MLAPRHLSVPNYCCQGLHRHREPAVLENPPNRPHLSGGIAKSRRSRHKRIGCLIERRVNSEQKMMLEDNGVAFRRTNRGSNLP